MSGPRVRERIFFITSTAKIRKVVAPRSGVMQDYAHSQSEAHITSITPKYDKVP